MCAGRLGDGGRRGLERERSEKERRRVGGTGRNGGRMIRGEDGKDERERERENE